MTRPYYETRQDLNNESDLQQRIQAVWPVTFAKLPISYHLDFALFGKSGKLAAMAEVKCRKNNHDTYDTLLLSVLKWAKGIEYARSLNTSFLVIVNFLDGDWFYKYLPEDADKIKIVHGGRTKQTRDAADIEPVVHIPIALFKRIEK